jgi:serine/threonine-protein kinase HipA
VLGHQPDSALAIGFHRRIAHRAPVPRRPLGRPGRAHTNDPHSEAAPAGTGRSCRERALLLLLARAVGIPTAYSEVRRFGDEIAIVVTRYDRAFTADLATAAAADAEGLRALALTQPILRLHQEDACQALGLPPTLKYQNEGGPSPSDIVELIRGHSAAPADDVSTFVDALAFNWLIGGTDAHSKNYSLLHGGGGRVRLAPLYDIASALPYPEMDPRRIKLAMRIGSKYRVFDIGRRHWVALAEELAIDSEGTVARIAEMASNAIDSVPAVRRSMAASGLDHPIVARLSDLLLERATQCARVVTEPR